MTVSTPIVNWYHPNAKKPLFKAIHLCRVRITQGSASNVLHMDMMWDGEAWNPLFKILDTKLEVVGWRQNRTAQLQLTKWKLKK